jgi:hypothetical protein
MSRFRGAGWLCALALVTLVPTQPASAGDDRPHFGGEVGDLVEIALRQYNDLSDFPLPVPDLQEMEKLLRGEVYRTRWRQPMPPATPAAGKEENEADTRERHRVVAMYLIERPMVTVWAAALDPNAVPSDKVTEVRLSEDENGNSRWYQLIDLPWPISNRHWVIDVRKHPDIAAATGGKTWEQAWYLVEDGEKLAYEITSSGQTDKISYGQAKGATYLEANTGAWATFEIAPHLSLLTYQVTVVLGGMLPEGLTARFAMGELDNLCRKVEARAFEMNDVYVDGYDVIYGGDGAPLIPPLPAP